MRLFLITAFFLLPLGILAQDLKPGFDPQEYLSALKLPEREDSLDNEKDYNGYKFLYLSPEVGLFNRWSLWERKSDGVIVIKIRGTVPKNESWLANFYAAMIPAIGSLQFDDTTRFDYQLAAPGTKAYVHTGWTVALGYMAPTIVSKLLEQYSAGKRSFIILGHSQGGAIAFLLRSYLYYNKKIPRDITIKTYCSAAPKPGNLNYAYDFDFITRGGWALRVVNTADWVPETPFSLQTLKDFNDVSIFMNVKPRLKELNFFVRLYAKSVYNKMNRTTKRSRRRFNRILGHRVYTLIKKTLPNFKEPEYANSHNYMLAGVPVVLFADGEYFKKFPFDGKNVFVHHAFEPYEYLVEKYYGHR